MNLYRHLDPSKLYIYHDNFLCNPLSPIPANLFYPLVKLAINSCPDVPCLLLPVGMLPFCFRTKLATVTSIDNTKL